MTYFPLWHHQILQGEAVVNFTLPVSIVVCVLVLIQIAYRRTRRLSVRLPPTVGSWIPWIGPAIEFGRDPLRYLRGNQLKYGPVYRIVLGGVDTVVVSSPKAIAYLLQDPLHSFTSFPLLRFMMQAIGDVKLQSSDVLDSHLVPIITKGFTNRASQATCAVFSRDLLIRIQKEVIHHSGNRIPLHDFIGSLMYTSVMSTIFGPSFPTNSYEDFCVLEDQLGTLLSPLPFGKHRVRQSRAALKAKIGCFLDDAWRYDITETGASLAAREVVEKLRAFRSEGSSASDVQGLLITMLWGIHTNAHQLLLWLMAHLLHDVNAMLTLREEIDRVIDESFGSDLASLLASPPQSLSKSTLPFLDSVVQEVMRLYTNMFTARVAVTDTDVPFNEEQSCRIREGQTVLVNFASLHLAEDYFDDAHEFKADRFLHLNDEKATIRKNGYLPAVVPFSQGSHICKGRDFALYTMKVFVIILLRVYDVKAWYVDGTPVETRPPKVDPSFSPSVARSPDKIVVTLETRP